MPNYKRLNPLLTWLWDLMSFYSTEEIRVPSGYHERVVNIQDVLSSDTSGIVNSVLDFAINNACVDYTIETDNINFAELTQEWFNTINGSLLTRVPVGIKPLAKEYFRERWKNSSFIVLRTLWENVDINGTTMNLPVKMWFIDGLNIEVKDNSQTRIIGEEKYYLKIDNNTNNNKSIPLPSEKNEILFIQKPYSSWNSLYPTPFLIQRGIYKNMKLFDLLNKKSERIVGKAMEYLLTLKKGSEAMTLKGEADLTYSDNDLKSIKDEFKRLQHDNKTEPGTPTYVSNFDTQFEHLIPDYSKALNANLYATIEKRLLSGLGLIEIAEGISSSRKEAILNPKPFIREVETGISDFSCLLTDVMAVIKQKNKNSHPKYFGNKVQLHYPPLKDFMNDNIRDHLRSMYDRGILSKETYAEVVGAVDIDIEATRRKSEDKEGYEKLFYPPIIQNVENTPDEKKSPITKENVPSDKKGIEKINYKSNCVSCGFELADNKDSLSCDKCGEEIVTKEDLEEVADLLELSTIVKKKDGWYVLSKNKDKTLGGPYKTYKEALKRLRQIEYFKHKGEEKKTII